MHVSFCGKAVKNFVLFIYIHIDKKAKIAKSSTKHNKIRKRINNKKFENFRECHTSFYTHRKSKTGKYRR